MSEEKSSAEGTCLCGAVTVKTNSMSGKLGACHCGMCRKWGGGPYMEVTCGQDVHIEGEDSVGIYSSSDWAERSFCKICGTHLFYRLKETGDHMVAAGLFGDTIAPAFDMQVFIDEKPDYYSFANDTKMMTGAEVFAMFAGDAKEGL